MGLLRKLFGLIADTRKLPRPGETREAAPTQASPGKRAPEAAKWRAAEGFAATVAQKLPGAKIVAKPSDESIEICWLDDEAVPLRITLDVEWDDLEVAAHAGSMHELQLVREPGVELDATADADHAREQVDRKVFFAKNIYVEGSVEDTNVQAALLSALPPELLAELLSTMERLAMERVALGGEVVGADVGKLSRTTDGGDSAIAFSRLLGKLVRALPASATPLEGSTLRCKYCSGYWFPTSTDPTCRHCGAPVARA